MPPSMALSLAIAPTRHSPSPAWRHLSPLGALLPSKPPNPGPMSPHPPGAGLLTESVARPPTGMRPRRPSLSVGVLQILSAAVQFGSSLWSSPLSAPMIFSFQANQGSWGLYW